MMIYFALYNQIESEGLPSDFDANASNFKSDRIIHYSNSQMN